MMKDLLIAGLLTLKSPKANCAPVAAGEVELDLLGHERLVLVRVLPVIPHGGSL